MPVTTRSDRLPPRLLAPLGLSALLWASACDSADTDAGAPAEPASAPAGAPERPQSLTDTIRIEGMPEEVALRAFEAPEGFPLPFTAYVPRDMAAEAGEGTAHFTAEFGGSRTEDAFLHVLVHPEGTDRQTALAAAKGYKTGRGLPVSQGLEIIADEPRPPHLDWAIEAYRFRYQSGGRWYGGTLGVGRHGGHFYQIVRHYPVEFEEGFAPRADLITETWRWADGGGLRPGPAQEPPPIVEDRPQEP